MRHGGVAIGFCLVLLLTSCRDRGGTGRPSGPQWPRVSPSAAGLDADRLAAIAGEAKKGKSDCLAVVRDGRLAGEWYFRGSGPDTTHNIFSATKSVTSTLVGIAQDDGDLKIGDNTTKRIPEWRGTPARAVTVRDLLS